MIAVDKGHDSVCRVLLEHGASLFDLDESGRTVLQLAERSGLEHVLDTLTGWSVAAIHEPAPHGNEEDSSSDDDIFGIGTWEADTEREGIYDVKVTLEIVDAITAAVTDLNNFIPGFADEADWVDVDINLPEFSTLGLKLGRIDADGQAHLVACIAGTLQVGFVSLSELRTLVGSVRAERQDELCGHLAIALSDAGVEIHSDLPAGWPESSWPIDDPVTPPDRLIEIFEFLRDLSAWRNNPMSGLAKDARRWSKLNRTDEENFGRQRDALVAELRNLIEADSELRSRARRLSVRASEEGSSPSDSITFEDAGSLDALASEMEFDAPVDEEDISPLSSDKLVLCVSGKTGNYVGESESETKFIYDPALILQITNGLQATEFAELFRLKDALAAIYDKFISSNLGLVHSISRRYAHSGLDYSDLFQEGCIGLMRATIRYDHRRGFKFSTFATWWIRQAVTRAIGDQGRTVRIPVHMHEKLFRLDKARRSMFGLEGGCLVSKLASRLDLSEAEVRKVLDSDLQIESADESEEVWNRLYSEPCPGPSPLDVLCEAGLGKVTNFVSAEVSQREAHVLSLRFGLQDDEPMTLEEVGRLYGLTRERIRQIEAKALKKLRHPVRARRLHDLLGSEVLAQAKDDSAQEKIA